MKNLTFFYLTFFMLPILVASQSIEHVDYISPFHDDVASVKKDGKWAFINKEGNLIIDFRTDLAITKTTDGDYPMFNDGRCKIIEKKSGISYFGFIDKTGKTVIEPQFLNTTNFNDNSAMALKLDRQVLAKNTALGKDMVNYRYFEVLINTEGEITYYLTQEGVNVVLDEKFLRSVPQITSKYLADKLYAVVGKNKTWNIIKIKPE